MAVSSKKTEPSSSADSSTQTRIIEAALKEFAEFGKPGARIDRIAELAGVNKAMIYYHFKSKDELYQESVQAMIGQITDSLAEALEEPSDLETLLSGLAQRYAEVYFRHPYLRAILLRELAGPSGDVLDILVEMIRSSEIPKRLIGRLIECKLHGQLRVDDERQAMATFVSMNIGFFLMAPVIQQVLGLTNKQAFDEFIEHRQKIVADMFLNGVRVPA